MRKVIQNPVVLPLIIIFIILFGLALKNLLVKPYGTPLPKGAFAISQSTERSVRTTMFRISGLSYDEVFQFYKQTMDEKGWRVSCTPLGDFSRRPWCSEFGVTYNPSGARTSIKSDPKDSIWIIYYGGSKENGTTVHQFMIYEYDFFW